MVLYKQLPVLMRTGFRVNTDTFHQTPDLLFDEFYWAKWKQHSCTLFCHVRIVTFAWCNHISCVLCRFERFFWTDHNKRLRCFLYIAVTKSVHSNQVVCAWSFFILVLKTIRHKRLSGFESKHFTVLHIEVLESNFLNSFQLSWIFFC